MRKKSGDLFTTTQKAIGHGVNSQGVMGAGIAKTFREKYPDNYKSYGQLCAIGKLKPGNTYLRRESGMVIANMATQDQPGADARYDWVFDSARQAAYRLNNYGVYSLAIPLIGCGIGGLEWPQVETLLRAVEVLVPGFEFEVWKF